MSQQTLISGMNKLVAVEGASMLDSLKVTEAINAREQAQNTKIAKAGKNLGKAIKSQAIAAWFLSGFSMLGMLALGAPMAADMAGMNLSDGMGATFRSVARMASDLVSPLGSAASSTTEGAFTIKRGKAEESLIKANADVEQLGLVSKTTTSIVKQSQLDQERIGQTESTVIATLLSAKKAYHAGG